MFTFKLELETGKPAEPDLQATTIVPDKDDLTSSVIGDFWRGCVDAYLAGHPPDDPLVSPVRGSLSGHSPALPTGSRSRSIAVGPAIRS